MSSGRRVRESVLERESIIFYLLSVAERSFEQDVSIKAWEGMIYNLKYENTIQGKAYD